MKRFATLCIALLVVGLAIPSDLFAQAKVVIVEQPVSTRAKTAYYSGTTLKNVMYHGLRNVGIGHAAFLYADTTGSGTTTVTSFAWTFDSTPTGSTAAFSNASAQNTYFIADSIGSYIVTLSVNGGAATHTDTIIANKYYGVRADTSTSPCGCHSTNVTNWKASPHSMIFKQGVTGNLEVAGGRGLYGPNCIRCHTVGHEVGAPNDGNFGYLAHTYQITTPLGGTGMWDTTWYKGLPTGYSILKDTMDIWNGLTVQMKSVGTIGCESCHGQASTHRAQTGTKTPATMGVASKYDPQMVNAGVCNQCHDAGGKHIAGTLWLKSKHSTMQVSGSHISSASCYPCHSGIAFVKFANEGTGKVPVNAANLYNYANDGAAGIGCPTCHDSHGGTYQANSQLRWATVDTLANGYVVNASKTTIGQAGTGELCINCHRARASVKTAVTKTGVYGLSSRFGPHHSPQGDIFLGQNGYEWGRADMMGGSANSAHLGALTNGCVDCHMQNVSTIYTSPQTSSTNMSHEFGMQDTLGRDMVALCSTCHSEATTAFSQINASQDYAGLGHTGTFYEQYDTLFNRLVALLPKDTTGAPLGTNGINLTASDSAKIIGKPWLVQAIWNYTMLLGAGNGVHNPAYSIRLLQQSIAQVKGATGVQQVGQTVPAQFTLDQNYPNPFNPTTQISFSIPQRSTVVMDVYDMLGKRVTTLVNEKKDAGSYRITWNGSNAEGVKVPSGVYFYRIQAGSFTSVKKMVMLK